MADYDCQRFFKAGCNQVETNLIQDRIPLGGTFPGTSLYLIVGIEMHRGKRLEKKENSRMNLYSLYINHF